MVRAAGLVALAATPVNVQSVKAQYAVYREAVNDGLDAIEANAAENEGWLEKVEDMLGHLQNVLDDIQAKQEGCELNRGQGQHNGPTSLVVEEHGVEEPQPSSVLDTLW